MESNEQTELAHKRETDAERAGYQLSGRGEGWRDRVKRGRTQRQGQQGGDCRGLSGEGCKGDKW